MSRFLLNPGNNTLSHLGKCLALREALEARGHETFLTASKARAPFLERIGAHDYFVLPDIQDADAAPLPGFAWFRAERFDACVRAEAALLRELRPDAMLGVFRFTAPVSAAIAGIPCDALICGTMTPAFDGVLGFEPGEPGAEEQAEALRFFRRGCARRIAPALAAHGQPPVEDIFELLAGRRTFLWDFPEFQPLTNPPGTHHVGPVHWAGWPQPEVGLEALDRLRGPIAYVAFGTGEVPAAMLRHLIDALWRMGCSVALALGGYPAADLPHDPTRLAAFEFLPVELALGRAAMVVCHGGQGLVFEALRQRLPVFVLPLQPEQAQNGVCVERMGCGRRLLKGCVFTGAVANLEAAFLARPADEIAADISSFLADERTAERLALASRQIAGYNGVAALATALEQA